MTPNLMLAFNLRLAHIATLGYPRTIEFRLGRAPANSPGGSPGGLGEGRETARVTYVSASAHRAARLARHRVSRQRES